VLLDTKEKLFISLAKYIQDGNSGNTVSIRLLRRSSIMNGCKSSPAIMQGRLNPSANTRHQWLRSDYQMADKEPFRPRTHRLPFLFNEGQSVGFCDAYNLKLNDKSGGTLVSATRTEYQGGSFVEP
jgi:hypothetical protein